MFGWRCFCFVDVVCGDYDVEVDVFCVICCLL